MTMTTKKVKTSVNLDLDLIEWVEDMIQKKRFANKTHAIEYSLILLKEQMEKEQK